MGLSGMNIEAVRALARQLDDAAGQLETLSSTLSVSLSSVEWVGPDADTARADWEGHHGAALAAASAKLAEAAQALQVNVEQQLTASHVTMPANLLGGLASAGGVERGQGGAPSSGSSDPFPVTPGHGAGPVMPPPPDQPVPDQGAGQWGSQAWYRRADDLAAYEVAAAAASAADVAGYTNASRHLRHYLNNTGEPLNVDVERVIRDNTQFSAAVQEQLRLQVEQALSQPASEGSGDLPTQFSSGWKGVYLTENKDWYYALGGVRYAVTGYVVPSPGDPARAEVHYQVHVYDRYNWDGGKSTQIGPVTITDEQMGDLQRAGLAREFDVQGSTAEQVTHMPVGDAQYQLPHAAEREGGRSDPLRDQQVGRSRVSANGSPR